MVKLINITELSRLLNNSSEKDKQTFNHTLRFWEKEFSQIRPKLINRRRYYSPEQVKKIKLIRFLLKDKGMTIKGVKNVLRSDLKKLDDTKTFSLKAHYYKKDLKTKAETLLSKIKKLKRYGKKNSY